MKKIFSIAASIVWHYGIAQRGIIHFTGKLSLNSAYTSLADNEKYLCDSLFYENARMQKQFECRTFSYTSGEVQVEGFLYGPVDAVLKKYPTIFYNRGGTGNFGRIAAIDLVNFHKLALQGFVVFATNYRFVNDKGPFDELGGSDMDDVINLILLAKKERYVDTTNLFMFGISRGGMMTYQAIKQMKLNAAAVIAGPTDYLTDTTRQAEFLEGWNDDTTSANENHKGLRHILPNFDSNKEWYLKKRSAVFWADSIQTPVLILHAAGDGFVRCSQSLDVARQLQLAKKEYSLKIYSAKSHSLPFRLFDSYDEIVAWFNRHKINR